MSESGKHDTAGTEEEDVDLEALLELFREPEAPPKKSSSPLWLILAVIASCLACWLAMRATQGTLGFTSTAPVRMKATKVRDRPVLAGPGANVREDYEELCRKGMTGLEIRWIAEDFRSEGLDEGPGSLIEGMAEIAHQVPPWSRLSEEAAERFSLLADRLAARQRSWYRLALTDTLKLGADQARDLRKNLSNMHQEDWKEFDQSMVAKAPFDPVNDAQLAEGVMPYSRFIEAGQWLADDRYAPWTLCQLNEEQLGITRHAKVVSTQLALIGAGEGGKAPSWFDIRPPGTSASGDSGTEHPPLEMIKEDAQAVFPFSAGQDFSRDSNLLELAEHMHPGQLKILLLLNPDLAGRLLQQLEQKGE